MTVLILPGDAGVGDVVAGHKFSAGTLYNAAGTIIDRGTVSTDITTKAQQVTIAAGKHSGSGIVQISATEQAKVIAANIKSGITLLGQAGAANVVDTTNSPAIVAGLVCNGYKGYINGALITGNVPVLGSEEYSGWKRATVGINSVDTRVHLKIPVGAYLTGTAQQGGDLGIFSDDANFIAANIIGGKTIFGLAGSIPNYSAGGRPQGADLWTGGGTDIFIKCPQMFTDGGDTYVHFNQPTLLAANIKSGVNICGVAGSLAAAVPAIQSVQRGQTSVPTGTSNLTINSVNVNATIVKYMDLYTPNSNPWSIQLTSATTLQFIQNQGSTQTMSWEAIEFNSALVRGVQRGSFVFAYTPNPFTVAISSINPAKAMLIISSGKYNSGALGYILNATTIAFASFNSGVTIFWQVIEFN